MSDLVLTKAAVSYFQAICKISHEIWYLSDTLHSKHRFLIGREKPGTESEVARLITETLEQEKNQQQQHLDDPYEHSTEEVSLLDSCSFLCHVHVTWDGWYR